MKDRMKDMLMASFITIVILTTMLIAFGATGSSQQVFTSSAEMRVEAEKLREALPYLSVTDPDWHIFVLPEDQWKTPLSKRQRSAFAGSCYTDPKHKVTYCNAEWAKSADAAEIKQSLAHERGHIQCGCTDERMANTHAALIKK